MQYWENIISTAMIGTDKKQLSGAELPGELQVYLEEISKKNPGNEDVFLDTASLLLQYRQAGCLPVKDPGAVILESPVEEKSYCNAKAAAVLNEILPDEHIPLLKLWLTLCSSKNNIAPPVAVSQLLAIAKNKKELRPLVITCCGKRGEWLGNINTEWEFTSAANEDAWQTGKPEERKEFFKQACSTDPVKAAALLRSTWASEPAASKAEFISMLPVNIQDDDIKWVEGLVTDKSQKVKEAAWQLLRQIPSSSIVKEYERILNDAVVLKTGKALLGIMNKTTLETRAAVINDKIVYDSGIEKLSNIKERSDDEHIIYQLISSVPPAYWEIRFNLSPAEVIKLFAKSYSKYIPAFAEAAIRFSSRSWAEALLESEAGSDVQLLQVLDKASFEKWAIILADKDFDAVFRMATARADEWSPRLAIKLLEVIAGDVHRFNKTFYSSNILLIPPAVMSELERLTPADEWKRSYWETISTELKRLLDIKQRIIQSF